MFDSKDMRNYNKNVDFNVLSFFPQNNDFNACKSLSSLCTLYMFIQKSVYLTQIFKNLHFQP